MSEVFCDWLDVTYSPDNHPISELELWLDTIFCPRRYSEENRLIIDVGSGKLHLQTEQKFARVSASGSVLSHLRLIGSFDIFLSYLASHPYKITRLDAACDYPIDGPDFLRLLERKYPTDYVNLQRKALRVTRLYSTRGDGQLSGTWYAGHRSSARVTARVYDKQLEVREKTGGDLPPTTRVELTFRKDFGCTLRDAQMPYSLYHQYASPALVEAPEALSPWEPHAEPWTSVPPPVELPMAVLKRRMETSPELARLAELCSTLGPEAEDYLVSVFRRHLQTALRPVPRGSQDTA